MIRNKTFDQKKKCNRNTKEEEKSKTKHPQVDIGVSYRPDWNTLHRVWFIESSSNTKYNTPKRCKRIWRKRKYKIQMCMFRTFISCAVLLKSFFVDFCFALLSLFTSQCGFTFASQLFSAVHLAGNRPCVCVYALFSLQRSCSVFFSIYMHLVLYYGYWFVCIFVLAPRFIRITLHTWNIFRFVCHYDLDTHQINYRNKQQFLQLIIAYYVHCKRVRRAPLLLLVCAQSRVPFFLFVESKIVFDSYAKYIVFFVHSAVVVLWVLSHTPFRFDRFRKIRTKLCPCHVLALTVFGNWCTHMLYIEWFVVVYSVFILCSVLFYSWASFGPVVVVVVTFFAFFLVHSL